MKEDIRMDEFSEGELVKIVGLDSTGSSKQEELASMMTRILSPYLMLKDYGDIKNDTDLNELDTGIYYYFIEAGGIRNSPGFERFILLQLRTGSFYVQIAFAVINRGIKWRTRHGNDDWQSWNAISFT